MGLCKNFTLGSKAKEDKTSKFLNKAVTFRQLMTGWEWLGPTAVYVRRNILEKREKLMRFSLEHLDSLFKESNPTE